MFENITFMPERELLTQPISEISNEADPMKKSHLFEVLGARVVAHSNEIKKVFNGQADL